MLGPGRAGTTFASRLTDAGLRCALVRDRGLAADADVVFLAVPDDAIADLAASFGPATCLAHLSGATPLSALGATRSRAFVWHAIQTLERAGGPGQLDGVPVTVTAASPEALAFAVSLGRRLRLDLHPLPEEGRPLPHLAAALAGNGTVTLIAEAVDVLAAAGIAGPEAAVLLGPLVRTSVDRALRDAASGTTVLPTGPVARGDATTVLAHRRTIARVGLPALDDLYVALARATGRRSEPLVAERTAVALASPSVSALAAT